MTLRDLQKVYGDELYIFAIFNGLQFYGHSSRIPEGLLDELIIDIVPNFDSGMECAWIEVYI